jgi:peroxiredoxin
VIPDVSGVAADGRPVRLRELAQQHAPLVLVFYRGGFCPLTAYQLRALAVQSQAFRDAGAQLVFVSPDTPEQIAETKAVHELQWPMLSDSDLTITKAFHLDHRIDEKDVAAAAKFGVEVSLPPEGEGPVLTRAAVFVVNREGKVGFAHADSSYEMMLAYSQILDGIKQANVVK